MAYTFQDIQRKLHDAFPTKQFTLIEFHGMTSPCVIQCPDHGNQRVSAMSNLLRSAYGCPECAAEAREGKLKSEQAKTVGGRKILHQLRSLPPTLSDAEFRQKVMELLDL